jgi:hypothetical protein
MMRGTLALLVSLLLLPHVVATQTKIGSPAASKRAAEAVSFPVEEEWLRLFAKFSAL